ncbi:uncharacterized protein LOC108608207 [Drosophila busckii]|uniref:uncharacterized protein LOC108608207 n=1 Tax=Drosophila busckii TaxID=30019 RepID=UPI00143346EC|nr:uncharacterized protein LOC108608207 [Drosophila busckii]
MSYNQKTHDSETEDIEKVDDEALQAALRDLVQIPDIEPESKVEKQISFHTEPKHERWLEQLRGRTQPSIEPLMSQKPKKDDKWITKHKKLTEQPAAKHETWAEKLKATTLSKTDKKSIEKKFEFQMCAAQAKLTASELHFKHLRIAAASKPKSFEELCHKPAHMASTQTLTVQAATVATGTELTHVEEAVQAVLQEQLPASQLGNVINIITVPSFQRGLNCQKSNEKDEKSFHLLPIKFPILQRLTEKLAQETESPVITPIATPRSSETFINTAVLIAEAPASLGVVANPMSLLPKTENVSHKWINSGLLIVAPDNPEIDAKPGPPASTVSAPEPETNPLIQTNPEAATNPPAIIEPEPESIPFSGSPTIEPNLEEPKKSTVERSESKGTLTIIGRSTRITTQYQDHCHVDRKDSGINKRAKRKLIVACVLCLVFMVCEAVGGILANSLAIATDAAHLLTDLVSFLISLFALHLSSRPATQRLNFGWYRAEVIGAMISVYFIWVLTGVLVWMAIDRLVKDVHYVDAKIMLISSALAILFNLVMAVQLTYGSGNAFYKAGDLRSKLRRRKPEPLQIESANSKQNFEDPHTAVKPAESDLMQTTLPVQYAHGHSHMPQENINVRAAVIHVMGDLIQSVGVFVAAIIIFCKPDLSYVDAICTILFGLIVLVTTFRILVDVFKVLMEGSPDYMDYEVVKNTFLSIEGVVHVHNLRIWALSINKVALSAHLAIEQNADPQLILQQAKTLIHQRYNLFETTIQIEEYRPGMEDCDQCATPPKSKPKSSNKRNSTETVSHRIKLKFSKPKK